MALGGVCSNKRRIIEATWWVAVLLSIAYIVSAITAAVRANQGHSPSESRPTAFAAVWSMLLLISIIAYGSVTMKKLQTPISVGVFIGVTAMFSQLELLMFAIFTQRSQEVLDAKEAAADRAIASVSFFLAVIFGIFTVMLFSFRQAIPDPAASAPSTTSDSYA